MKILGWGGVNIFLSSWTGMSYLQSLRTHWIRHQDRSRHDRIHVGSRTVIACCLSRRAWVLWKEDARDRLKVTRMWTNTGVWSSVYDTGCHVVGKAEEKEKTVTFPVSQFCPEAQTTLLLFPPQSSRAGLSHSGYVALPNTGVTDNVTNDGVPLRESQCGAHADFLANLNVSVVSAMSLATPVLFSPMSNQNVPEKPLPQRRRVHNTCSMFPLHCHFIQRATRRQVIKGWQNEWMYMHVIFWVLF